jgi:hypothetical protein
MLFCSFSKPFFVDLEWGGGDREGKKERTKLIGGRTKGDECGREGGENGVREMYQK